MWSFDVIAPKPHCSLLCTQNLNQIDQSTDPSIPSHLPNISKTAMPSREQIDLARRRIANASAELEQASLGVQPPSILSARTSLLPLPIS